MGVEAARRLAVLVLACCSAVAGCGAAETAADRAAAQLAELVRSTHDSALAERAADPAGRDQDAADRLARAVTGANPDVLVAARTTPDGVETLTTVGVLAEVGGGLSADQASLGACVRTRATTGSASADVGARGRVVTEAVPCPDGVVPVAESAPVEAVTTELQTLSSPVPRPEPVGCPSGSGECEAAEQEPACPASGLLAGVGLQEAASGLRVVALEATNCSTAATALTGYPTLTLLDASGAPLPVVVAPGAPEPLTDTGPRPLTLLPGQTAVSYLSWRNSVTDVEPSRAVTARQVTIRPSGTEADGQTLSLEVDLGTTGAVQLTAWRPAPAPG